jgi:hypothetical protein
MDTARKKIVQIIDKTLIYTVFFPFIPAIIWGTDTQPNFSIVVLVMVLFMRKQIDFRLKQKHYFVLVPMFVAFIASLFNRFIGEYEIYWNRIFSFCQFFLALFIGISYDFNLKKDTVNKIYILYFIFTIIFLLTNGAVENLVLGRYIEREDLLFSGRGARTLSSEPTFFAISLINIFIIDRILKSKDSDDIKEKWQYWVLFAVCLVASYSGYGALLLLIIVAISVPTKYYPFAFLLAVVIFVYNPSDIIESNIRFFYIINSFLASDWNFQTIDDLILVDASIGIRFWSFKSYLDTFINNPLLGDAFSLKQGGGFVSLPASLGVVGLVFVLYIFKIILLMPYKKGLKILLILWYVINFISGPIGIPANGLIIGLIIKYYEDKRSNS